MIFTTEQAMMEKSLLKAKQQIMNTIEHVKGRTMEPEASGPATSPLIVSMK
jgi:hypothetical protein